MEQNAVREFVRYTTASFTGAVLMVSVASRLSEYMAQGISEFFTFDGGGLPHQMIFQILVFAAVNSGIIVIIPRVFKRIMVLWQMIINMFACLIASAIVMVVMGMPVNTWQEWLGFVVVFIAMFLICAIVAIIVTVLESKRYDSLLSDYKKQKGVNDDDKDD